VICVTHFAQVAKAAMHHFGVYKTESNGIATTTVKKLVQKDLEIEYNRMIGH
jgi:DNA repair ATPase RecN